LAASNVDTNFNEAPDGLVFVQSQDVPAKLHKRLWTGGQIGAI